ncbi:helix-turn-helix domain-containing protein [Halobacterium sp. KA-4]|uniref:helix-turn-helix domain-containing protein n=1 Tax=Halobacterium sp. KA-4 TaxID=2896367 RepID=UPI001E2E495D|nr:helix-turn-helix domain-containing protein [Halobacterium sp. KA-4]MCD2201669.1 helix-turn-helix domain-containing protein [Halobacterium sp. KA-4]
MQGDDSTRQERNDAKLEQIAQDIDRERLYELDYQNPSVLEAAFAEGYDAGEVAVAFGVSEATIYRWKSRFGLSSSRSEKLPDDFGKRIAAGMKREKERRETLSQTLED